MTAPTQQLPPWLSASVFDVNGQPETSFVYIPLPYSGPSIPLGTLYTFVSSPASATATPTTTSSNSVSSATPSTFSSSSVQPTSSSSSETHSSSPSSSPTPSPTPTPTPTPTQSASAQSHGLEKGQLIGVIIASILGFIFLFVLALFLYLWWNARRNRRRASENTRFAAVPFDDDSDFVIIPPGGRISPGEGSPRASGEEADSFLRRNEMQQVSPPVAGPSTAAHGSRSADNSLSSSSKSSNSAASGYGTLLANPSLGVFPSQLDEERRGKILSSEQLRQFDNLPRGHRRLSTVGEQGELAPLAPPPRLIDASHGSTRSLDRASLGSQVSDPGEVLTARRVRAEDLGPRSAVESSRKRDSLKGLGLAALGWFQSLSSSSRRNSQISPLPSTSPAERDIEAGQALLNTDPEMSEAQGSRFRGQLLGVGYAGNRPISGASASSHTSTIYHDAQSSLPGTPVVMPPPRAFANSSSAELGYWPQTGTETASSTTAAQGTSHDLQTGTQSTVSTNNATTVDVLDTPAPRGISPFTSSNSLNAGSASSKGSQGKTEFPYPPGLTTFSMPTVWSETTGTTPSPGSFAATPLHLPAEAEISIDVLEEEPPSPGDTWRSLAGGNTGGARRTTFGQPQLIHLPEFYSEQGSLHSMRSHLSPVLRSTGSASASRREQSGSSGSASSRPSARSAARSIVSGSDGSGASLAHSGSISSSERRKNRVQSPMSPALSAFGPASSSEHSHDPSSSFARPLSEELSDKLLKVTIPTPIPEVPTIGNSSLEDRGQTSPRSPRSTLSSVPWAAGLDDAWSPS